MNPLNILLLIGSGLISVISFLAFKFKIRHLNWLSLPILLFTHGCTFAMSSFNSSFGTGTGTEITGLLLALPFLLVIAGVFYSGKNNEN